MNLVSEPLIQGLADGCLYCLVYLQYWYTYIPMAWQQKTPNIHDRGGTESQIATDNYVLVFDCTLPVLMESTCKHMYCRPCIRQGCQLDTDSSLSTNLNHVAIEVLLRI